MDKVMNGYARAYVSGAEAQATEVRGVDLSFWQGVVDWELLASRVHFAYIRAGYGNSYLDPKLAANVAGAAANDVPYGLYWYLKPDKDWKKHAESFAAAIHQYGCKLYPVLDLEETGGLSKSALDSWVLKFVNRFLEVTGYDLSELATYTSAGFLNTNIPMTNYLKWTNLWVAHWTLASQPIIPYEWAIPLKSWKFWQYSAKGDGAYYGTQSKSVDLNRYNGSLEQFEDEFNIVLPDPLPTPLPEPIVPLKRVKVKSTVEWLNVRAQPAAFATDLGDLIKASVVPVVEVNGDWYRIDGWVHKDYVTDA